jgi:hypothetical protein
MARIKTGSMERDEQRDARQQNGEGRQKMTVGEDALC